MNETTGKPGNETGSDGQKEQTENSKPWLFQPGQSGNPAGRPKGTRNALTKAYLEALAADFREHGPQVIEAVRVEKPEVYMKCVAMLVPKEEDLYVSGELKVTQVLFGHSTPEQLEA